MKNRTVLVCALWALTVVPVDAAITVSVEDRSVTAHGLTPGGGAVFFSVGHEPHTAYYTIRRITQYVADDDRDGTVSYTASAPIPWKSIWFVVDTTGKYAVSAPADFPDRVTTDRRSRLGKGASGDWTRLVHERPWLEILVIRPGGDVWELTAMRGGVADTEKRGMPEFVTPVALFRALTPRTRALDRLTPADTVIAIDPNQIEYFIVGVE